MKQLSRLCLALSCLLGCLAAHATSVVFLNPGHANERFWVDYSLFMQDAADDLGMQLRVLYGERDNQTILANAHQVLRGAERPDYLLFANEQYLGPEILRLFAASGVKLFALHSTLTAEQQQRVGGSREQYANWIGSLVPNDEEAGYLMAKALIRQAPQGEMVAFSGIKQTPSATLREAGLRRALAEHPQVRLRQLVFGEWREARAYEQAKTLLPRYPEVRLAWAANDEMAFGVMRAAHEAGRQLHYSALNTSQRALTARLEGRIAALAGGHFILGGCAMAMLHDHAAGLDFAEHGGKDQQARPLRLLDGRDARRLLQRQTQPGEGLDFRRFSLQRSPRQQAYSCSIDALLR
ncbi:putative ABC transporter substrate-binding protein [Pseudomonas sp. 8AS]|uniref:ABC transporter substrate-binding protein n=1 Tax=Pseudomonas sp. 8AS TaxID=2653163 RepID=UPI0012F1F99C|nr:ABC transporter substrate-binding protein [Pseudomonas sp. 8AS]VXC37798.1 putative ABC transporter substrate-binding protein [Pseudomonas sp. 8AS]